MIHNNLGMVLMRLHEPTEEEKAKIAAEAAENDSDKPSFMLKKRNKNANRDKALQRAKEQFGKALELDEAYIKPRY